MKVLFAFCPSEQVAVLLIFVLQWNVVLGQLNLQHTEQTVDSAALEFDCLSYRVKREELAQQTLFDVVDELIPYCIRPSKRLGRSAVIPVGRRGTKVSFSELSELNITVLSLLSWSNSIELVERYQLYLNAPTRVGNELFFNCTEPWFGVHCEYSFEFDQSMSLSNAVRLEFQSRVGYGLRSTADASHFSCYVLLQCDRGGAEICLDWREICDEVVDCLDGGADEEQCFPMEINECEEEEYRCQNGLCIPAELWDDGQGEADCLDRSDEAVSPSYSLSCFQDPTFRCEEHSCRPDGLDFPCGDGECALKFSKCQNGRHLALARSLASQGSLPERCWIAMVCLNGLLDELDGTPCELWVEGRPVEELLADCHSFYPFPSIPIHWGHVRLFYNHSYRASNETGFLFPDYVCYDQQLCPFYSPSLLVDNLSCLHADDLEMENFLYRHSFSDLMEILQEYFRGCSITHGDLEQEKRHREHPSLYRCEQSSKVISRHKILDLKPDCHLYDDETYAASCALNDRFRRPCPNEKNCVSPLVKLSDCPNAQKSYPNQVPFQQICNGINEVLFIDSAEDRYLDEEECHLWPCDNLYTRCDGFWSCPDGRDEENCYRTTCPPRTYACLSPVDLTLLCLSAKEVNDGVSQCLGGADEQVFCRLLFPFSEHSRRFNCDQTGLCLKSSQLCDNTTQCLKTNDDERFCPHHRVICDEKFTPNRSLIETLLCGLSEHEARGTHFFSLQTAKIYPSAQENGNQGTPEGLVKRTARRHEENVQLKESPGPWLCHRGLRVHRVESKNKASPHCFCPPSSYGERCEYQNQRVSLSLRLSSRHRQATFALVSMLIDENADEQQIEATNQFVYVVKESCSVKINRYFLFSRRPKDLRTNYSVRIDAFEKNSMSYVGSWHLSIPFLFLPVNRLAAVWHLDIRSIDISPRCSTACRHGQCTRYLNKDTSFCRCASGWSGRQCDRVGPQPRCSPTSIALGVTTDKRSICVCPLDKFGPHCWFQSTCPLNACENGGQCLPADLSIPGENYICVCPEKFFGSRCQYVESKVLVTLVELPGPRYLVAYFFTLARESAPSSVIILQKLTLFQRVVTFRIRISFHLVLIKAGSEYYLAVLQHSPRTSIATSISPRQRCASLEEIFEPAIVKMPRFERVKLYHRPCQTRPDLQCFTDEGYFCLCTNDRQVNCVDFDRTRKFQCHSNESCENAGQCLQDHPRCPAEKICVCTDCFFGDRCQFYAKGLGSTLDEILGYEIRRNTRFAEQPFAVRVSAMITMLLFLIGVISGTLSILTFSRPKSQEVGCGVYLLASSFNSLIAMCLFVLKYWFLFLSHQHFFGQQFVLYANCLAIEPLLKIVIYVDNWLNALVAAERAVSVFQGITFDKGKSKRWAKWIILSLCLLNVCLFAPQLFHLRLFVDEKEERTWCVVSYTRWLHIYSSSLIFFHYFTPLLVNLFSALFIIFATARQRLITQNDRPFLSHLRSRLNKYKHLLLSPLIIILLTLPHLIISIILDCNKSSSLFWFYLLGYFLAFFPAVFVFVIFALPSALYKREFREIIHQLVRRLRVFKLKHSTL